MRNMPKDEFLRKLGEQDFEFVVNDIRYQLYQYKSGEITIGKAAEIAKKDLREMMLIASNKGIHFQYSLKDLREDFKAAQQEK